MTLNPHYRSICERALKAWGTEKQVDMMIEEIGELLSALGKCKRGRTKTGPVVEELADLQIVLWQMIILFGEDHVKKHIDEKIKRTEAKIEEREREKQKVKSDDEVHLY